MLQVAAMCSACAGQRQTTLLPAMRMSWVTIRAQASSTFERHAIEQGQAMLIQADEALQTATPAAIAAVPWKPIEQAADADVTRQLDEHLIGENGAVLARERLVQFAKARETFCGGGTQ